MFVIAVLTVDSVLFALQYARLMICVGLFVPCVCFLVCEHVKTRHDIFALVPVFHRREKILKRTSSRMDPDYQDPLPCPKRCGPGSNSPASG